MNIFNRPRYIILVLALSIVLVVSAYAQTWEKQPKIPANSSGLKKQIEALALRVDALEAENAILKAGQLNLTAWAHLQLSAQILEVEQYADTEIVRVCDLSEPTGVGEATKAEFLTASNIVKSEMEAHMFLIQPQP